MMSSEVMNGVRVLAWLQMAKSIPREMWDVKNMPTGDSRAKLKVKKALCSLEEWLPASTWDVKAGRFWGGAARGQDLEAGRRGELFVRLDLGCE